MGFRNLPKRSPIHDFCIIISTNRVQIFFFFFLIAICASLAQEDALEKEMQPPPVFLPGKLHGGVWWATVYGVVNSQT